MRPIVKALAAAVFAALAIPVAAQAATAPIVGGQHASVMNSIAQTQQRNNAAIGHVRSSIAASQRRNF